MRFTSMPVVQCYRACLWLLVVISVFCGTLGLPPGSDNGHASTAVSDTVDLAQDAGDSFQEDHVDSSLDSPSSFHNFIESSSSEAVKQEIVNDGNRTHLRVSCPSPVPLPADLDPTPAYSISDSNTSFSDISLTNNLTASSTTAKPETHAVDIPKYKVVPELVAKVDFTTLEFTRNVEISMESKGCHHVVVDGGIPDWVEQLSLSASEGRVILQNGWAEGARNLKKLWFRISEGLIVDERLGNGNAEEEIIRDMKDKDESSLKRLCQVLPPTLEFFIASNTPLKILHLGEHCSSRLIHLEASHCALTSVALCAPSLVTLHLSRNSIEGSLDWVTCKNGLTAVEYLQVNQNFLSEVSTCGWDGLKILDVRRNAITSLDLSSCPSSNLTSVRASHNEVVTPPILSPALLHLELNHNLLESLPMITGTLMSADFSHNNIIEIGKSRFKRARKLLHLNLAHNHITHLKEHDLMGLRELKTLDLSHNRLREVAGASLMTLRNLQSLYIHHNHLTKLDARDLASLTPRAVAVLHHNPWQCSCQLLRDLQRLQHCPNCQHQIIPVECREQGAWLAATAVLHSCLQAVQEVTQRLNDESDEDLSEEIRGEESGTESKAVMAVPGLLVLVLIGAVVAMSYRLYVRHKRTIISRLHPICSRCRLCSICGCSPEALNNNDLSNHRHGQLSHNDQDSDTETEL